MAKAGQMVAMTVPREALAGLPVAGLPQLTCILFERPRPLAEPPTNDLAVLVFCDCSYEDACEWVVEMSGGVCDPQPAKVPDLSSVC